MWLKNIEFNRKLIHLSSLFIPITYYYVNKNLMISILIILFILTVIWDILRLQNKGYGYIAKFSNTMFLRSSENSNLSGAFYFLLSCLIGIIIFSKYIFILSVSILIICDTMAALIGINFGRHKICNKSLEGAIAFCISGLIVVGIINYIFNMPIISKAVVLSVFGTSIAELFSNLLKINDNLLIILIFGIFYYLTL